MIADYLIERVRDVGLLLFECNRFDQRLGRLQLQKLVYLFDSLVLALRVSSVKHGHKTYLHGPFDPKIQNAVDVLVFRGLAEATGVMFHQDDTISCNYSLTAAGNAWVVDMIGDSPSLLERRDVARALVEAVVRRNAFPRLRKLVYSEPTYALAKARGYEVRLELDSWESNLSAQLLALLERSLGSNRPPSPRFLADVFLEFLERRHQLLGVAGEEG